MTSDRIQKMIEDLQTTFMELMKAGSATDVKAAEETNKFFNTQFLGEIAYQLAIMNERKAEADKKLQAAFEKHW